MLKAHESDARYLSYACGLVCHFALDVTCHGYIDEKIEASGATHTEIEVGIRQDAHGKGRARPHQPQAGGSH